MRDAPAPPALDASSKGWVNLVWRDWVPTTDEEEEGEEPLEDNVGGCMRVAYQSVIVDIYAFLRDWDSWLVEYRRPPAVVRG